MFSLYHDTSTEASRIQETAPSETKSLILGKKSHATRNLFQTRIRIVSNWLSTWSHQTQNQNHRIRNASKILGFNFRELTFSKRVSKSSCYFGVETRMVYREETKNFLFERTNEFERSLVVRLWLVVRL